MTAARTLNNTVTATTALNADDGGDCPSIPSDERATSIAQHAHRLWAEGAGMSCSKRFWAKHADLKMRAQGSGLGLWCSACVTTASELQDVSHSCQETVARFWAGNMPMPCSVYGSGRGALISPGVQGSRRRVEFRMHVCKARDAEHRLQGAWSSFWTKTADFRMLASRSLVQIVDSRLLFESSGRRRPL
eukprot:6684252-Alexandrium_andersonii.AAC.1